MLQVYVLHSFAVELHFRKCTDVLGEIVELRAGWLFYQLKALLFAFPIPTLATMLLPLNLSRNRCRALDWAVRAASAAGRLRSSRTLGEWLTRRSAIGPVRSG